MFVANLDPPTSFRDKTPIVSEGWCRGLVSDCDIERGFCMVHVKTAKTAGRVLAHAQRMYVPDYDLTTGEFFLQQPNARFSAEQGIYLIELPQIRGHEVFLRSPEKVKTGKASKTKAWCLVADYERKREEIKQKLDAAADAYNNSHVYSLNIIFREDGVPYADNDKHGFYFTTRERTDCVFRGNDIKQLQVAVRGLWPSTRERELIILDHGLTGNDTPKLCRTLPWNSTVRLIRTDKLLLV